MHNLVTTFSTWSAHRCVSSIYLLVVFSLLQGMASCSLELVLASCTSLATLYAGCGMVFLAKLSCLAGSLVACWQLLAWCEQTMGDDIEW